MSGDVVVTLSTDITLLCPKCGRATSRQVYKAVTFYCGRCCIATKVTLEHYRINVVTYKRDSVT